METHRVPPKSSRRDFIAASSMLAAAALAGGVGVDAVDGEELAGVGILPGSGTAANASHPLLTPAEQFDEVARGTPRPDSLVGEALVQARLTPDSWRLEVVADPFVDNVVTEAASLATPLTLADRTALDLPTLMEMGRKQGVRYLKAMQCLNISEPLGQGLWEGVPLRDVLRLGGRMHNVRRIYYWGFHNNDPKQIFQSSLSYTQAMETPPGEMPAFLAYRLNGAPISLKRGGPVRMVVPWAYGFKSIKWLQRISVTNDFRANDTYANQNNDPESQLKTAAYIDPAPQTFTAGKAVTMSGRVMSGWSGLRRVEYWLRAIAPGAKAVIQDDETYRAAQWIACDLESAPADWGRVLPAGVSSKELLGFDPESGRPGSWPLRYSMVSWSTTLRDLKPGKYEFRARAVDGNGIAQPEPRPIAKAGRNGVEVRGFEVV